MFDFYDQLTPFYHLIYGDWEAAIETQATQLSTIISKYWHQPIQTVLDVSCGIGTQAIGLADKGFRVTASDVSAAEVKRAKEEAKRRHLDIHFSVCDMREAYRHHQAQFDLGRVLKLGQSLIPSYERSTFSKSFKTEPSNFMR